MMKADKQLNLKLFKNYFQWLDFMLDYFVTSQTSPVCRLKFVC